MNQLVVIVLQIFISMECKIFKIKEMKRGVILIFLSVINALASMIRWFDEPRNFNLRSLLDSMYLPSTMTSAHCKIRYKLLRV